MSKRKKTHYGNLVIIASGASLPSRIELMPVGDVLLSDGRGLVATLEAPDEIISKSFLAASGGEVLVIDFDHGIDGLGEKSGRAAGWITGMMAEGNRIMATVEWTDEGRAALEGKSYRFISPVFRVDQKTKRVTHILRAALTNDPAIHDLKMVASKETTEEDGDMNPHLAKMAKALGLDEDADEATITAAVLASLATGSHAEVIMTAAGLTGALTEVAATAIATKITASNISEPDPAKFVPMEAFTDLTAKVAALTTGINGDKTERLVTAAMESGKVSPAMENWAKDYAAKDHVGFTTWLASQPIIVDGNELIPALRPTDDNALTSDERQICAAMGLSHDDYLATKTGKKPEKKETQK